MYGQAHAREPNYWPADFTISGRNVFERKADIV